MDLLYLGEAGVLVSFRGGKVAIDPVSYHINKNQIVEECENLKLILITHEHKEHFDRDLIELLFSKYKPYVIAPRQVLAMLSIDSTYKSDIVAGDVFELSGFEVHVLPAFHPQSKYAVSYLVKNGKSTLYHAGDTYETDEMYRLSGNVAVLPIRGMETMGATQVGRMCHKMKFDHVIPVYWSDRKDLVEFMLVAKDKAVKPKLGEWVRL